LRPRSLADTLQRSLSVNPDCVSKFNELKLGRGGPKYIIYKISDDQKEVVVDEVGNEPDYDTFREKLIAKKEANGKDRPSYAIYDVEFELEGGEGKRYAPEDAGRNGEWTC
jgi:cofilin